MSSTKTTVDKAALVRYAARCEVIYRSPSKEALQDHEEVTRSRKKVQLALCLAVATLTGLLTWIFIHTGAYFWKS